METTPTYATATDDQPIPVRDLRTERRFFVDNTIVRDYGPTLGVYGVAVYSALCMHANLETQQCYPSHRTIAEMLDCSVSKVKQAIRQLEELHLIETEPRYDARNERQTSNLYTLLNPPIPPGTTDTPPPYHEKTTMNNPQSSEQSFPNKEQESADADLTPHSFEDWYSAVQDTPNRAATLKAMHDTLFAARESPAYSYIATVAKRVGGAGRLAQLLWQAAAQRPTGDVLAYIQATEKGRKNGNGRHDKQGPVSHIVTEEECVRLTPEQEIEFAAAYKRGEGDEWIAANLSSM